MSRYPFAGAVVHVVDGSGAHLEGEITHAYSGDVVDVAVHSQRLVIGHATYAEPAAGQEYSWHWPETATVDAPEKAPGFWRTFGRRAADVGLGLLQVWGTAQVRRRR